MMTSRTPSPASRWTSSYSFEPCFFLEAQTCGLGWTRMSALSISPLCSIEDVEVIPCVDDLKFSGLPTPNVTWASLSLVVSSKRKASLRVCVARLNCFIARSKATDHPALAVWLAQTSSLPDVRRFWPFCSHRYRVADPSNNVQLSIYALLVSCEDD